MRALIATLLSVGGLAASPAQSCSASDNGICFKRPDGKVVFIEPAFEDYLEMMFDLCDATVGKSCYIPVLMGDLGYNAIAARLPKVGTIIVYDRRLSAISDPEVIIAHELGHIHCGHLDWKQTEEASHTAELQADRFAGIAMRQLGRPREALDGAYDLLNAQPSLSHPGRSAREAALQDGYDNPEDGYCR